MTPLTGNNIRYISPLTGNTIRYMSPLTGTNIRYISPFTDSINNSKKYAKITNEAIRIRIQPSKPKREITNNTNTQNTKITYGQPSEQLILQVNGKISIMLYNQNLKYIVVLPSERCVLFYFLIKGHGNQLRSFRDGH